MSRLEEVYISMKLELFFAVACYTRQNISQYFKSLVSEMRNFTSQIVNGVGVLQTYECRQTLRTKPFF